MEENKVLIECVNCHKITMKYHHDRFHGRFCKSLKPNADMSRIGNFNDEYSRLLELLGEMHELHFKYVKRPSRVMRLPIRKTMNEMIKLLRYMRISISEAYNEQSAINKATMAQSTFVRPKRPPRGPNGKFKSNKDPS